MSYICSIKLINLTITIMATTIEQYKFIQGIGEREFNLQETWKQLTYGNRFWVVGSWGVSKKVNFDNKVMMLQVNGALHKGKIYIVLAYDDTYTIYQTTNQNRVIKKSEMIYFDMLTDTIDKMVETKSKF
ncbi:MAG: hypothetical protein WD512_11510 [Candidatus Paceibacterota bacterium]